MPYKKWYKISYMLLVMAITIVIAFNFIVNPYYIYKPKVNFINIIRPEVESNIRVSKAYTIMDIKPEIIILGNSRALYGINPDHKKLIDISKHRYNCSFPSASIYEIKRYLEHAQHVNKLKHVIIALDLEGFNINNSSTSDYNDDLLYPSNFYKHTKAVINTFINYSLSLKTTKLSIKTLHDNFRHTAQVKYLSNGQISPDYQDNIIKSRGFGPIFKSFQENYINQSKNFSLTTNSRSSITYFADIMRFCAQNDIKLHMYISPIHARLLDTIKQAGHWNRYQEWKHMVAVTFSTLKKENPHLYAELYDFSGYTAISTEAVPEASHNPKDMRYYWDCSHYKPVVGDQIIDVLFSHDYQNANANTIISYTLKTP